MHLCADITGWEPSLLDAHAFITRGHKRKLRLGAPDAESGALANLEINLDGRRCTGYDFSKTAPHSCCIYDKTREIVTSRKDWMEPVWESNGWDGSSRVIRVEFRYERECLKELGVEDPYAMLDQLPGLWAYSTQQWLRHTIPTHDTEPWPLGNLALLAGDPAGRRSSAMENQPYASASIRVI